MTWLFILIDVLIFLALLALCIITVYFWNKKSGLGHSSLEKFRNEEIYEKSQEEQKRMAHIEDTIVEEEEFVDDLFFENTNTESDNGGFDFEEDFYR